MDDKRIEAGQRLLDAALEYWNACQSMSQHGSVQWLEGTGGELLIFTRGEYRGQLMRNIAELPNSVVHYFGERLPSDEEE